MIGFFFFFLTLFNALAWQQRKERVMVLFEWEAVDISYNKVDGSLSYPKPNQQEEMGREKPSQTHTQSSILLPTQLPHHKESWQGWWCSIRISLLSPFSPPLSLTSMASDSPITFRFSLFLNPFVENFGDFIDIVWFCWGTWWIVAGNLAKSLEYVFRF